MEFTEVRTDENGRELATFGTPMFPMSVAPHDIRHFVSEHVPWHWHKECEFNLVTKGALEYEFAGGCECLEAGEAMFVNSDQIHAVRPHADADGLSSTLMLAPDIVSGSALSIFHTKYVLPVIRNENVPVLFFRRGSQIPERLARMAEVYDRDSFSRELELRILVDEIWLELVQMCVACKENVSLAGGPYIKKMLAFIHEHYADQISLDDIADSAGVSVRTCCRAFNEQLHVTAFGYLMEYRVREAARMLAETSDRITDISYACGFSNPGYFTRTFRSITGRTPSAYRKEVAAQAAQIQVDAH